MHNDRDLPYGSLVNATGQPKLSPLQTNVKNLQPGYFALVMATGIISIGVRSESAYLLSDCLLAIAAIAYTILLFLTMWRLIAFSSDVLNDLRNPAKTFGFFTFVAGTDVLGVRLLVAGHEVIAIGLLIVGGLCWLLLGYLVPWATLFGGTARPLIAKANGTWFIWVVASQSVAVLSATLEPLVPCKRELALVAVFFWAVGVFLYAATGIFVAIRLLNYDIVPADLNPPYWVAMGATAITVLAGARIVEMASAPMIDATRGTVAGTAAMFWAFGTWLIPALLAAGWWRHVTNGIPLRYEPTLWSMVFPLGMYAVASQTLGVADSLPIVAWIGKVEIWIALAVWAAVFIAMVINPLSRRKRLGEVSAKSGDSDRLVKSGTTLG